MGLNVTYSTIVLSVSQYNKQSQKKITSEAFLTFIKHTCANCDSVAQAYTSNFQLFFCRIDFGKNSFKYGIKMLEIDQHFLLKSVRISHSNL